MKNSLKYRFRHEASKFSCLQTNGEEHLFTGLYIIEDGTTKQASRFSLYSTFKNIQIQTDKLVTANPKSGAQEEEKSHSDNPLWLELVHTSSFLCFLLSTGAHIC